MTASDLHIWGIIAALAVGTFLIRFSFIGMLGDRELPNWVLRYLRYTTVGVMPGLVAPLVLFPAVNGGQVEPIRLAAALATLGVGFATRSMLWAIVGGFVALYAGLALFN
ncbi:MAG: AzlD domain-containing protein [Pseudomonadota bacterium]